MRSFGAAFLGTIAAILFVVAVVAFLAWREMKALEPQVREKVAKRIDEKLDELQRTDSPPAQTVVASSPESTH